MQAAADQVIVVAARQGVTLAAFAKAYSNFRQAWPQYANFSGQGDAGLAAALPGFYKVPKNAPPGTGDLLVTVTTAWAEAVEPGVKLKVIRAPAENPDTWTLGQDVKNVEVTVWMAHMIKAAMGNTTEDDVRQAFERAFAAAPELTAKFVLEKLYTKWRNLCKGK